MMKKEIIHILCAGLLTVGGMIPATAYAQGAENTEETAARTVTVHVDKPGNLENLVPVSVWEDQVDTMKISGELNSYDLRWVRRFCGSDEYGAFYPTQLKKMDLSEATIVPDEEATKTYYILTDDQGTDREYSVEKDKPTLLPDKLFFNCCSIESLVLPKNIREIGIGAFFKCFALKEIVMPDEITHIYSTAFGVCDALETIKLPSHLVHLGGYAFTHCSHLRELTFPDNLTQLHMRMFDQAAMLTTIHFPKNLKELDKETFYGATGLVELEIPEGITSLPKGCIGSCSNLKKVVLPASLKEINESAFQDDHLLETVVFKEGLQKIDIYAFKNCENLHDVALPNSLTDIANEAFIDCKNMSNLTLGTGLKTIGEKAFFHNHGIKSLTFPDGMKTIDYAAFAECMGLEKVDFGRGIPELVQNPFLGCFGLKEFVVSEENEKFATADGVLYARDFTQLYSYPNGKESKTFVMNDQTRSLDDFSFWYCKNLEEITFSPAFDEFGARAFCGCENLKKLIVRKATPVENYGMDDVFEGVKFANCRLVVPVGSKEAYQASPTWNRFQIEEEVVDGLGVARHDGWILKDNGSTVRVENIAGDCAAVTVHHVSGQLMARTVPVGGNAMFDASAWTQGVYIITLQGADGTRTRRFVHQ